MFLEHARKWLIMQEAPSSKAVRQGDPREQGCVWKIWRSAWSSMTTSLLLYTPPFFISNLSAEIEAVLHPHKAFTDLQFYLHHY